MINLSRIRADFPIFNAYPNLVYLDNAATTHKPRAVIEAINNFYSSSYGAVYRGVYALGEQATSAYESARSAVARFINAQPQEIAFTSGTTASINTIAYALRDYFKPGDEIILSELEHHANLVPWQQLALHKNLTIKFIKALPNGTLDSAHLNQLLNSRTKLISVTHCSNITGALTDIGAIVSLARQNEILVMLDAAQSAPHRSLDVKELDVDFVVFSGHKMLGPTGIGVLYAHERVHSLLEPYQTGGGMVFDVDYSGAAWRSFPYKFEAGTPLSSGAIGLEAALVYLQHTLSFKDLYDHELALCTQFLEGIKHIPQVSLIGEAETYKQTGHLVSFMVDNWHPHDVAAFLDRSGICVRAGHQCAQPLHKKLNLTGSLRASFYIYNNPEDVEALLKALHEIVK